MSSPAKPLKDKQHVPSPRLVPRATAASTARAARNACNRNLIPSQRQSPSRVYTSQGFTKERGQLPRLSQKNDSKTEVKERCNTPRLLRKQDSKTDIMDESTKTIQLQNGVRQGDIVSPKIFTNTLDYVYKLLDWNGFGININQHDRPAGLSANQRILQTLLLLSLQRYSYMVEQPQALDLMNITVIVTETANNENIEYNGVILQDINENEFFDIKHDPEDAEQMEGSGSQPEFPVVPVIARNVEEIPSTGQTPEQVCSRPVTPKSGASSQPPTPRAGSRPTTPRGVSRPPTPANPHHGTMWCVRAAEGSRPSTPHLPTRPTTPRNPAPQPPRTPSQTIPQRAFSKDDEDIKTVFALKQKQYNRMKKELDLQQQAILEVFDTLRSLSERMCREGVAGAGGEGLVQELVVFNVADWTSDELAQLCRDAAADLDGAHQLINTTLPIDECALQELDEKVSSVPARFADLCLQAYTARQELIDWVKELIENNALREDYDGSGTCLERIARYNAQGLQLCEALRELKGRADDAVDTVTQLSRRACRERSALVAVGESLVREIARLRQDIEGRFASMTEMQEMRIETEATKALEEVRRELEEERSQRAASKDKLATTESQLRQMRIRVSKMDRQLRESEASITTLTSTVKTLEDQSRQKEVQMEARARKLKESLKTGEMTTGHLAQQRDSLQTEISQLKEQIATLTSQHKAAIQELTDQLKETKYELETQRKNTQAEIELKESAEAALAESRSLIESLNKKIKDIENSIPNPDLPTEREMDLWAELQATKDTLRVTEDEVSACKREKARFLETFTKIAETESKVGMQQKLAGELLSKEEIMGKMQIQIRELTKNIKLNEQKVIQYEQYVRDLQAHNRAVAKCLESPNGITYEDLQQEIMGLKMKLLESVHRNEELAEVLVQKDQQIEQQDKTSRAQARVIKVREELINMLKNKETEQSRELTALQQDFEHRMKIVDGVNKQIAAKASEIRELFGTLENKQQQIHRLEKVVLALEEQQRRAQAQRIRHEEKIAALEHELAAGGNRREKKFLFF